MLIKNAEALEVMEKVDTLVVDKTGTLTEGKPRLVSVIPASGKNEDEILRLAASLERGSEHPLAAAIVDGTRERGIKLAEATDFRSVTGKGVIGTVDGKEVGLGNQKLLEEMKVRPTELSNRAEELRRDGQTVMSVVIERQLVGLVGVADPIKKSTPEAIQLLHK